MSSKNKYTVMGTAAVCPDGRILDTAQSRVAEMNALNERAEVADARDAKVRELASALLSSVDGLTGLPDSLRSQAKELEKALRKAPAKLPAVEEFIVLRLTTEEERMICHALETYEGALPPKEADSRRCVTEDIAAQSRKLHAVILRIRAKIAASARARLP